MKPKQTTKHPKVALVMVNYNGGETLERTLHSLFKNTNREIFHLYLVDNDSKDNSVEFVKKQQSKWKDNITLIESEENVGFGAGNNIAIKKIKQEAKVKNFKFVGLINTDLLFSPNWLTKMLDQYNVLSDELEEKGSEFRIGALNPLLVFSQEFKVLEAKINQEFVYMSAPAQPRALSRLMSKVQLDSDSYPEEFQRNLTGMQLVRSPYERFELIVPENATHLELNIFDPFMTGFELEVEGQKLLANSFQSFKKKLTYFLTKNEARPPIYKFEVDLSKNAPSYKLINSFGGWFKGKDGPRDHYFGIDVSKAPAKAEVTDYFHGACVIIPLGVYEELEGFDERYFMYYEDADFSLEMRSKGYITMATPEVRITHLERVSSSGRASEMLDQSYEKFKQKWF